MRITRRTNILIKTERRFVVKTQSADEPVICAQCREPMISAQMSAALCGISSRVIYRLIEAGEIHFAESERHEVYVCLLSVRRILD